MDKVKLWLPLLGILLTSTSVTAAVQKPPNPDNQALKKAQGMVRQLGEEKAVLETEKTALQEQVQKLDALVKQLAPLQTALQQAQAGSEVLSKNNATLQSQLLQAQQKQQNLQKKLQEVIGQAKQIQSDNQLLVSAVKEREQWITQCTEKNHGLLAANHELIDKYQHKGLWQRAAELEPFTGIAKVETQATVESYQYKLEDLTITDFGQKPGTP
jgi:chromosome segregation ATPase